jgi:hypothetical protein
MKIHFKPKGDGFKSTIEEVEVEWVEVVTSRTSIEIDADSAGMLVLRERKET